MQLRGIAFESGLLYQSLVFIGWLQQFSAIFEDSLNGFTGKIRIVMIFTKYACFSGSYKIFLKFNANILWV